MKIPERDKDALRELARLTGESMSVVVRRLIRQEAQRCGILSPIALSTTYWPEPSGGRDE
jgi:hypothetical protein